MSKLKNRIKSDRQFKISTENIASVTWKVFAVLLMIAMFVSIAFSAIALFLPPQQTQVDPAILQQLQDQINQQQVTNTVVISTPAPTK